MARVTTEDCIDKVPNRFDLVMLAAYRAREISSGESLTVDRDNDKNPVVALREIAEETQSAEDLLERTISSLQRQNEVDEPDDDEMSLLSRHFEQGLTRPLAYPPRAPAEGSDPDAAGLSEEAILRQMIEDTRDSANG